MIARYLAFLNCLNVGVSVFILFITFCKKVLVPNQIYARNYHMYIFMNILQWPPSKQ